MTIPTPLLAATSSTGGDLTWLWAFGALPVLALALLWLAAVVSIIASDHPWGAKLLFVLGTLAFPFLGPLVWFLTVRGRGERRVA